MLSKLNLKVTNAGVGLVSHVYEPFLLPEHFSNYHIRTKLLVLTSIQSLNREDLCRGALNRIQVCLYLIERPSGIIDNCTLQMMNVIT